jgi:hypothetical protein
VQRDLGALGRRPHEQQQGDRLADARAVPEALLGAGEDPDVLERAQLAQDQERRQHHADVADHVHHEGLLGRGDRARPVVVEADQQVRGQAHQRPADDQEDEVGRLDQQQHREDEEAHLREEAPVVAVLGHVLGRVEDDQRADAGDHQHHQHAQRVDQDRQVDRQVAHLDPLPEAVDAGPRALVAAELDDEDRDRAGERAGHRADRNQAGQAPVRLAGPQRQHEAPEQGQSEHDPSEGRHVSP